MKAIFSRLFREDLTREEAKYREISERLAGALHECVAAQAREIIRRGGGDHIGPHGFPCRWTRPFPFYIYYEIRRDTVYFLSLVHERRHPSSLRESMPARRKQKPND